MQQTVHIPEFGKSIRCITSILRRLKSRRRRRESVWRKKRVWGEKSGSRRKRNVVLQKRESSRKSWNGMEPEA